jgi:hypothetical protein
MPQSALDDERALRASLALMARRLPSERIDTDRRGRIVGLSRSPRKAADRDVAAR